LANHFLVNLGKSSIRMLRDVFLNSPQTAEAFTKTTLQNGLTSMSC
jgi:hypothetical protein